MTLEDVAIVQQGVEEMLEGDVFVAPLQRLVDREFKRFLELTGNHGRTVPAIIAGRAFLRICGEQNQHAGGRISIIR